MNQVFLKRASLALFFVLLAFSISPLVMATPLSDIEGHDYEDTISILTEAGIVSGYPDGTYQPNNEVNRVEFLKIVVGSTFDDIDTEATDDTCGFSDTVSGQWYIPYLCRALEEGIVQGYPDGTFKPEQAVNFVEASKIAALAHGQDLSEDGSVWYEEYVTYASDRLFIPPDIEVLDASLTRGQVAELLGRYYLYDQGELESYLGDHDFDYVFFNVDEIALNPTDKSDVVVNDYINAESDDDDVAVSWLTYEELFNKPLQESEGDWTFTGEAGEDTGILINWNYLDAEGLKVDLSTDEEGTDFDVENTEGYQLDFNGFLDVIFQDQSYSEFDEDTDFSGTLSVVDEDFSYDWSEDRSGSNASFEDSFSWADEDSDSFYERSIVDGVPLESLNLVTPEVSSEDTDQTIFSQEFQYDENTGGVENWLWQSSDADLLVNQVMKDDYYTEFLGFSPSDQLQLLLEYDQDEVTESLDFSSSDGAYVLNMDMTDDDFNEVLAYSSDEMDLDLVLSDMNNLDGTVTLSDNSGEEVEMTFVDNVLSGFTAFVQDGSNEVRVSYTGYDYSDYEDYEYNGYGYFSGVLTTEGGSSYSLFTEEGMVDHGLSLSTDEISVDSDFVSLSTSLVNLSFDGSDAGLQADWEHSSTNEQEQGSLLYQGLLSEFTWGLDLGDKEAYDEGQQSGSSLEWFAGFDLALDPNRLIQGELSGGVKGKGVKKDWSLEFDPESAELNQDLSIDKEGFKKDFEAKISLLERWLRQQMQLKGEFKGIDVDIDSDTTVEDGKVNGTTNVHASTDTMDSDFSLTFGSGQEIELDGNITFTPPSLPGWIAKVDLILKGNDVTIKPKLSLPLVDNDDLGIDLELGGDFRSDGQAQGSAKVNIRAKNGAIRVGFGATVDEGGKFGGVADVSVELKW